MSNPINNNVFDTRDLIEYKEELEQDILDAYIEFAENHNDNCEEGAEIEVPSEFDEIEFIDEEAFTQTCEDIIEEYKKIKDFCEELGGSPDFEYGEAVIHEDYFTEYCEEMLKDCGYIPQDFPSWIELDFEATAENIKQDYMEVDFEGDSYYIRA